MLDLIESKLQQPIESDGVWWSWGFWEWVGTFSLPERFGFLDGWRVEFELDLDLEGLRGDLWRGEGLRVVSVWVRGIWKSSSSSNIGKLKVWDWDPICTTPLVVVLWSWSWRLVLNFCFESRGRRMWREISNMTEWKWVKQSDSNLFCSSRIHQKVIRLGIYLPIGLKHESLLLVAIQMIIHLYF